MKDSFQCYNAVFTGIKSVPYCVSTARPIPRLLWKWGEQAARRHTGQGCSYQLCYILSTVCTVCANV